MTGICFSKRIEKMKPFFNQVPHQTTPGENEKATEIGGRTRHTALAKKLNNHTHQILGKAHFFILHLYDGLQLPADRRVRRTDTLTQRRRVLRRDVTDWLSDDSGGVNTPEAPSPWRCLLKNNTTKNGQTRASAQVVDVLFGVLAKVWQPEGFACWRCTCCWSNYSPMPF